MHVGRHRLWQTFLVFFLLRGSESARNGYAATITKAFAFDVHVAVLVHMHAGLVVCFDVCFRERQQGAEEEVLRYGQLRQNFRFVHLKHPGIDLVPALDLKSTQTLDGASWRGFIARQCLPQKCHPALANATAKKPF